VILSAGRCLAALLSRWGRGSTMPWCNPSLVVVAIPAGQPDGRACRRVIAAVISPGPGPAFGDAEPQPAAAASEAAGDGAAHPKALGFPAACVPG
jgi:hypothetical protein